MKPPIPTPDPKHPDMSPAAIDQRLRELSQLYRFGMSIQGAKWIESEDGGVAQVGSLGSLSVSLGTRGSSSTRFP